MRRGQIVKTSPHTEVLILTIHRSEEVVREVLKAGARGYVLKSDADQNLVSAVEMLLEHKPFLTPDVTDVVLLRYLDSHDGFDTPPQARITAREREIIQLLLSEGKSNKQVAVALRFNPTSDRGNMAEVLSQTKAAFLYGGGADFDVARNVGIRADYRGFVTRPPDFTLPSLTLGSMTYLAQPSIGVFFRF